MSSRRGTWPRVADLSTVIPALHTGCRNALLIGDIRVKVALVRRDVIEHPVRKPAWSGRIGIVENQGKRFGSNRRFFPREFGRDVLALTGEATRDRSSGTEIRTHQLHGHLPMF